MTSTWKRLAGAGALLLAINAGAAAQPSPAQDGHYVGSGVSLKRGAAFCPQKMSIRGFRVAGGQLRFGNFRGPVERDGSVRIVSRGAWLTGRFDGTVFRGEIDQNSTSRSESCYYVIQLTREAS